MMSVTQVAHVLGMNLVLDAAEPVTADAIADIVEKVVDALDDLGYPPSVSTSGAGSTFTMTVEVATASDDLRSFEAGVAAIALALASVGVAVDTRVEHPTFRSLELV